MAYRKVDESNLSSLADKIRAKGGTSGGMVFPAGFLSAVDELPDKPVIQSLEVTENGTYSAPDGVDGYSPVTVNVAASGGGASEVVLASDRSNATEVYNMFRAMCDEEAECNVWAYKGDASTLGINNKLVYLLTHKHSPSTAVNTISGVYVRFRNGTYDHSGNVSSSYDLFASAGDIYIHWALKP